MRIKKISLAIEALLIASSAIISSASLYDSGKVETAYIADGAGVGRSDVAKNLPNIEIPKISVEPLGDFEVTAYCSCERCCGEWAIGRPIDEYGNSIVYGCFGDVLKGDYSVAVDFSVIPYGSNIMMDGKLYKAQDRGGAIKGNRVDIYLNCHQCAVDFGVQNKKVYILRRNYEGID